MNESYVIHQGGSFTEDRLALPKLKNIKIDDFFWNKYIQLVTDVIIPYQWDILNDRLEGVETSHCIENFHIAAGLSDGEFYGAVFQDTDLAKWLEAVAYSLAYEANDALEADFDRMVDLIEKAQWEDGYINTYYTLKAPELRFTNLQEGHELYTAGHLIEAAVAYYLVSGKDKFLRIMMKFADLIYEVFVVKGQEGYPGHQEIELALVKLYEVTGQKKYLELAYTFIDRRGQGDNYFLEEEKGSNFFRIFPEFKDYDPAYSQSHLPVKNQLTVEGHAVRATYMYSAMADLAYYTEDDDLLKACEILWDNMTNKRMYITGGIGSSGLLERFTTDYDLPNDDNYSETCASIGLALFGRRLASIKKDASYYDAVEKALYNVVLAGLAMDGKSFFYVNPLEVWPPNCLNRTSKEHVKAERQEWFGVACCPPNINRTLASLGEYIYFNDKDTVYINLFISNESQFSLEEETVEVNMETNFPYDNKVKIRAKTSKSGNRLAIRVPGYVEKYDILVNGQDLKDLECMNHYVYIDLSEGLSEIDFVMDVEAHFVYANSRVRDDQGKVALVKGPLVYCLEEVDNGDNLTGIYVDTDVELEESFEDELLGGIGTITFKAKKIMKRDEESLYHRCKPEMETLECKAVPYSHWGNRAKGEMLVWIKYLNV